MRVRHVARNTGFVDAEVKAGRYTEEDRQAWIDAWSQPGSTTAGLSYYRANHRNPPFNDTHPASTIDRSWSAKGTHGWCQGHHDSNADLRHLGHEGWRHPSGHLSGLEKLVRQPKVKLYPDDDHWVMLRRRRRSRARHPRLHRQPEFPERVGLQSRPVTATGMLTARMRHHHGSGTSSTLTTRMTEEQT